MSSAALEVCERGFNQRFVVARGRSKDLSMAVPALNRLVIVLFIKFPARMLS